MGILPIAVSFSNAGVEELMLLCKSCVELKESQAGSAEIKEPLSHSSEMEPQPPSVELEESPAPSGELTDTSNRYAFFSFFLFVLLYLQRLHSFVGLESLADHTSNFGSYRLC